MAKLKFYLDTRQSKFGKEAPLKLSIRNNNTSAFISLGISLLPSHWDAKNEKVIVHPRRQIYNNYIEQQRMNIREIVLDLLLSRKIENMTASDIKKFVEKSLKPISDEEEKETTFIDCFRRFIDLKQKESTKSIYQGTLNHLYKFCDNIEVLTFEDINKGWLTRFDNYLAETSPSKNARNIHLRNIRAVFNDAIDENITTHYPFRKYKIRNVETAKRSLTIDQLRELINFPVEEHQEQYRDMFLLIFFLIGINTIDLFNLTKQSVRDGRIIYHRAKTGRLHSIKIEPEALAIIKKYKGSNYLLNPLDRYANYKDYRKKINKNLQEIGTFERVGRGGKKVHHPLFTELTTYWARHTWATIASEIDIPKETISAALGHEIGSRITSIYINFDQKKVDEANRKVIDYVLYNKV
jgi:site-specific recombinase XerD